MKINLLKISTIAPALAFLIVGALCITYPGHTRAASNILGDVNGDGQVTVTDLSIMLSNYNKTSATYDQGDLDANGKIDAADLGVVSSYYGKLVTKPTTPPVASAKLRWAPPQLTSPVTINVPANGDFYVKMDANKDYRVIFPPSIKHGGVYLHGGKNIVIMGGHAVNDIGKTDSDRFGNGFTRGIYIYDTAAKDVTGTTLKASSGVARTVHIEGYRYDGSVSGTVPILKTDGIAINAPAASIQIENTVANSMRGGSLEYGKDAAGNVRDAAGVGYDSNYPGYWDMKKAGTLTFWKNEHSDLVQPFGGFKDLRIDRFTGDTNCQGFFLRPDTAPMGAMSLSNVNLTYDDVAPRQCGELLWFTNTNSAAVYCQSANPITLSNIYLDAGIRSTLNNVIWPKNNNTQTKDCPAVIASDGKSVTWPKLPITGSANLGKPTTGDYVPLSAAGINYVSPGYQ